MNCDENVQVVQELYAAIGAGDVATALSLLAEDVDWQFAGPRPEIPFAGRWRGREQVASFFRTMALACEIEAYGPNEVMAFEDYVLSLGCERARVRATNRRLETDWIHLFTVRHGRIVRLREYRDTATMAAAFRP